MIPYMQMCQRNLLSKDDRDASLGSNQGDVEWDGANEKSFTITYKGGEPDDKKKERYMYTIQICLSNTV